VIRRTLFEWKALRYGEGKDEIPAAAADRLAAVARASPLGGEGGARILSHGRKNLRAGQVVGVLVARDCALEILPKIDLPGADGADVGRTRRQLVHMLAVALDMEIAAGAITELGWQRENLLEILIGLFARKLADAVHRGMPRRYLDREEDLPVLRGRLDVTRQFTRLAASPERIACRFDALSPDIALNQVMKAAIARLSRVSRSNENQRRLRELDFAYTDITSVPLAALRWHDIVLDRTNARWRELVNLARLLLGERFQTTSEGAESGFSLLFEMNTLFEAYVARMLTRALAETPFSVHAQGGRLYCLEDADANVGRFMTKPDILVKAGSVTQLIIDTKWKRLARRMDDPKQGVSQADVYQMMAYGRLYGCPRLILLYPHHQGLGGQDGVTARHRIHGSEDHLLTATLDVSDVRTVRARLRALHDAATTTSTAVAGLCPIST
jgi:5-methylcytosine-specific restriction enzyme subunit McrC